MIKSVEFDLVTKSPNAGVRGGASMNAVHAAKRAIEKARATVTDALKYLAPAPPHSIAPEGYGSANRITVTLTRIATGLLDEHDNLRMAFKPTADAVAAWLGMKDNDPRIVWEYRPEKAPGLSAQGPCPVCLMGSGRPCTVLAGRKMQVGFHVERRTPPRVRITVSDLVQAPARPPVVLASTAPQKRPKAKKKAQGNGTYGERGTGRGSSSGRSKGAVSSSKAEPVQLTIGDDEQSPRVLVPCSRASCFAALAVPCVEDGGEMIHGVHVERARAAGVLAARQRGGANVKRAVPAPPLVPSAGDKRPRRVVSLATLTPAEKRQGAAIIQRHYGPRDQSPLPLVRVLLVLPWLRLICPPCTGQGTMMSGKVCPHCNGTGRGKAQAVPEPRLDGLRPPVVHRVAVPPQYASAHGKVIEMYPRRATVAGCDVVIYETKEARR